MGIIKQFQRDPILKRRIIALIVAHVIMGCTANLVRFSLFGTDPYTCMNIGFSRLTDISVGTCMVLFCLIAIVPIFIIARSYIQFGTLINMFLFGPLVDLWYTFLSKFPIFLAPTLTYRIIFLAVGLIIGCAAASLYMCAKLGMGPYDAIGWIVQDKTGGKISFKYARVALDLTATATGFVLGSLVGVSTFVVAFCMGPLVAFYNDNLSKPLIYGR